jgi:hypothetical protein
VKRCRYQGKRKYHSQYDAIMAAANKPWWNRMRPYLCPHCGFWHLTSQPKRTGAA